MQFLADGRRPATGAGAIQCLQLNGRTQEHVAEIGAGQGVCVAVAAGGRLELVAPGQTCTLPILRPAWIRLAIPEVTAERCARDGVAASMRVRVQGACGAMWLSPDPHLRAPGRGEQQQTGAPLLVPLEVRPGPPAAGAEGGAVGRQGAPQQGRDLGGWIGAALGHGPACELGEWGSEEGSPEFVQVAANILARSWPGCEQAWAPVLGQWLQRHVQATLEAGAPRAWQWPLTILAWLMETAGICDVFLTDREHAEELVQEAGFTAAAMRQLPFRGWGAGRATCVPGVAMPGMRSVRGQNFARIHMELPPEALQALSRLVATLVAVRSAAPGEGPSAAPMACEPTGELGADREAAGEARRSGAAPLRTLRRQGGSVVAERPPGEVPPPLRRLGRGRRGCPGGVTGMVPLTALWGRPRSPGAAGPSAEAGVRCPSQAGAGGRR